MSEEMKSEVPKRESEIVGTPGTTEEQPKETSVKSEDKTAETEKNAAESSTEAKE